MTQEVPARTRADGVPEPVCTGWQRSARLAPTVRPDLVAPGARSEPVAARSVARGARIEPLSGPGWLVVATGCKRGRHAEPGRLTAALACSSPARRRPAEAELLERPDRAPDPCPAPERAPPPPAVARPRPASARPCGSSAGSGVSQRAIVSRKPPLSSSSGRNSWTVPLPYDCWPTRIAALRVLQGARHDLARRCRVLVDEHGQLDRRVGGRRRRPAPRTGPGRRSGPFSQ